jgi:hypothetical protein
MTFDWFKANTMNFKSFRLRVEIASILEVPLGADHTSESNVSKNKMH